MALGLTVSKISRGRRSEGHVTKNRL